MSGAGGFDARELFAALARHDVEYVTIGGLAVQAHGGQRLTQDLDIAIASSSANLERLARALQDVDARILGPEGQRSREVPSAALLGSSDLWRLITAHGPLDIVTLPAHLGPFEDMFGRAHLTPLGDVTVPIAHRDDLIEMKRASGRPQDLADIRLLESLADDAPEGGSEIAGETDLDAAALRELESSFRGEIVLPTDPSYDERRRIWNASIDRSPAVIACCAEVGDVVAAVRFAQRTGLVAAVRSGGHSFPGLSVCDGGMVIDLRAMATIEVDPEERVARAGAGVLLGELDRATQAHGLAVPAGIVTHTGLAGLTLGGGIGWLMRKHGLTIDKLLSVQVVTADGELVTASATENADLFWGIRGGGGNFGIVTELELRLEPLGPVLAGPIFWRIEESARLLRFYRDWIAEAPDELMTIVNHRKAPPLPFVPAELHGELVVSVVCCWCGSIEEGERAIAPLRAFGSPVIDACRPKPYLEHQAMFDPSFPHGRWYYMRACDVGELTDDVIDTTVEHSMAIRSPLTTFPIWQMGGAVARVDDDETAFDGRAAGHTFNITAMTDGPEGFAEERDWSRRFWSALEPHHESVYVNFLMDEGEQRVRDAYGAAKWDRLTTLKRRYDPGNFFRLNQNIPPV